MSDALKLYIQIGLTVVSGILLFLFIKRLIDRSSQLMNDKREKYYRRVRSEFRFNVEEASDVLKLTSERYRWSVKTVLQYFFPAVLIYLGVTLHSPGLIAGAFIATLAIGFVNDASFRMEVSRDEGVARLVWTWMGLPYRKTVNLRTTNGIRLTQVDHFHNGIYTGTKTRIVSNAKPGDGISGTISFRADQDFIANANEALVRFSQI